MPTEILLLPILIVLTFMLSKTKSIKKLVIRSGYLA
jgi:hypothetical protein